MSRTIWLKPVAWLMAIALVSLPIIGALNGWFAADKWPLKELAVKGSMQQVTPEMVRAAIKPHLHEGFFAVKLNKIQNAVEQLPWVARAEVRKHWPDQIEVRVVERVAFATWGKDRLLSSEGVLFAPTTMNIDPELPRFAGPENQTRDVMTFYQSSMALLQHIQRKPLAVELSPRGAWRLILNDGVEMILGQGANQDRLQRFVDVFPRAATMAQGQVLRKVDLRYANGFALTWEDPNATPTVLGPAVLDPTVLGPSAPVNDPASPAQSSPSAKDPAQRSPREKETNQTPQQTMPLAQTSNEVFFLKDFDPAITSINQSEQPA